MRYFIITVVFLLFLLYFFSQTSCISTSYANKRSDEKCNASNTFIDARDGKSYKCIKLKDGKTWMAENLNYWGHEFNSWCSDFNNDNCTNFGRLYIWEEALKACPSGWYLPSEAEWNNLLLSYDNEFEAYRALIKGGDSGFSASLGGDRRMNGQFKGKTLYGSYWSSTSKNNTEAWNYDFFKPKEKFHKDSANKVLGYSCRCIKEH